jgi:adenine-specific DNA-methyltransferase
MSTHNTEPEKFDLRSHDIAEDKRQELLRLFPEIRTEDGKLDFDTLKLALGESVDVGKERYGMTWPGKADCFKTIQTPSLGTLRPCPDESVNFDTTENLIIEGDNLEVLKLLQKSYLGKVKMIYIDPPYNTGNDFIYPDNYTESLQTYLAYTGQVDAEGRKFGTNTDTGRVGGACRQAPPPSEPDVSVSPHPAQAVTRNIRRGRFLTIFRCCRQCFPCSP